MHIATMDAVAQPRQSLNQVFDRPSGRRRILPPPVGHRSTGMRTSAGLAPRGMSIVPLVFWDWVETLPNHTSSTIWTASSI